MLVLPQSPSSSNTMSDLDATMTFQDDEASVSGSSVSPQQESKKRRIRQNLSHLSQEEKLNRRKMKNRVAAQSARDRRKAKFEELEKELAQLSEERFKLARENARLRKHTISLEAENKGLKQRLSAGLEQSGLPLSPAITVKTEPSDESITATDDSVASFGSAAEARKSIRSEETVLAHADGQCDVDDALRLLGGSDSDEVLEWLERCSELIAAETQLSQGHQSIANAMLTERVANRFGAAPIAELRDLIATDHIYHQPLSKEQMDIDDPIGYNELFPDLI